MYKCNNIIFWTFSQALAELSRVNSGKVFKLTLQGWVFCASKKQKAPPAIKTKITTSKVLTKSTQAFAMTKQALKGTLTKVIQLVKAQDIFNANWQLAVVKSQSSPCKLHCLHQTSQNGCSDTSKSACSKFNR